MPALIVSVVLSTVVLLPAKGFPIDETSPLLAPEAVAKFYETRNGTPAWLDQNRYEELIEALEGLENQGLEPSHYHLQRLREYSDNPQAREKLATDAWLSAAAHMVYGKLDAQTYEPDWTAAHRQRDLTQELEKHLASGSIANSLTSLAPAYPEYLTLTKELSRLRASLGLATVVVPPGPSLKPGVKTERVEALQSRLVQLGWLESGYVFGVLDESTVNAVRGFQASAGLEVDGVAGPETLSKLNQSTESKIEQIKVNLERWRWLPDELGQRHIRVNIADFSLWTYENGQRQRMHQIIVGQRYRKTPVFSARIRYVVLNPWWETPPSITRKDKLPLFKQDPDMVTRLGFQVIGDDGRLVSPASIDWASLSPESFPYRIRQAPGPLNALGRIKIMFPNKHSVYLHDTPSRDLFSERQRAFSSGCLRTQDPIDLAAWIFKESPEWNKERFESVIATGRETHVNLTTPVWVHILYFTVAVDPSGVVRYLDDIYDRDAAVRNGLLQSAS